jgi:hypothetical protein
MPDRRVRVGFHADSEKSIGVLVDVKLGPKLNDYSASRLEWFPKSLCSIEKKEIENQIPQYYLTAPDWLLKTKNVSLEPKQLQS